MQKLASESGWGDDWQSLVQDRAIWRELVGAFATMVTPVKRPAPVLPARHQIQTTPDESASDSNISFAKPFPDNYICDILSTTSVGKHKHVVPS